MVFQATIIITMVEMAAAAQAVVVALELLAHQGDLAAAAAAADLYLLLWVALVGSVVEQVGQMVSLVIQVTA